MAQTAQPAASQETSSLSLPKKTWIYSSLSTGISEEGKAEQVAPTASPATAELEDREVMV